MAAACMDCRHLLHRSGVSETAIANIRWKQRQRCIRQSHGPRFRRDAAVLQPLPTSLAATLGEGVADRGMGSVGVRREEEEEEEGRRDGEEEEEEEEEERLHQRRGWRCWSSLPCSAPATATVLAKRSSSTEHNSHSTPQPRPPPGLSM
jgi:hypothetical protein